jgi:vacuolar-type H+-ATPase subunit H
MASGFLSVDEPEDDLTGHIEPGSRSAAPQPLSARSNHAPTRLAVADPPGSEEDDEIVLEPDRDTGAGPTVAVEPVRGADVTAPEVLDRDYRPLLDRIEHQWSAVVSTAQSEADTIRSNADRDARRILADAHLERSLLLERAAEKLAVTQVETEQELARWVSDFDDERRAVLDAAQDEADRLLRAANALAGERARARLVEAERDARRILTDAAGEADRMLSGISVPTSAGPAAVDVGTVAPIASPPAPPAPREPAPPAQATTTPSPAPAPTAPSPAAAPEAQPTTEALEEEFVDGRRFWEDMFWGCQAGGKPQDFDLEWLSDDGASRTPRATPRSESVPPPIPPQVAGHPKVEWVTLVELVLSVLGILVVVLLLLWLWSP